MVCGGGEALRWLPQVLEQRSKIVDDMVICLNNGTDAERKLINRFGYWVYSDDREWGIYQPQIKQDLLEKVARLRPDWILAADADEIYDKNFTREAAEKLMSVNTVGYYFAIINLWGDELHYRHDASFWNIRFWNYKEASKYGLQFERKRLHCGLAPPIVYKFALHAPYMVKHYGLMLPEDRKVKAARYDKYDPKAQFRGKEFYDKLRDNSKVNNFDENVMHQRVENDVVSYKEIIKKP